mgnify:CR=1 FL=1
MVFRAHPLGRKVTEVKPVTMSDPTCNFACNGYKGKKKWGDTNGRVGGKRKEY